MATADPTAPKLCTDRFDRLGGPSFGPDVQLSAVHEQDRGALEQLFEHLRRYPEFTVARLDVRVRGASGDWQWREAVASSFAAGEGARAVHLQWREIDRRPPGACHADLADDRLQFVAAAADDIISVADCRRQTLYASPALVRITGYTLEEVQASDFAGRVHPDDVALVELARDLNLRGQGTRIEYRYKCKGGEYVWLDSQATPVLSECGSVDRIVLTTRDITLRKAAERQLQCRAEELELLSTAVRDTAQQIAGQLVTALDRLTAVEAALVPDSAAAAPLEHVEASIRSAAELAGRLAALATRQAGTQSALCSSAAPTAGPPTVLLVDDDESVRASLLALLRARGARVTAAADGQEALDLFVSRAAEIDVVVLDQNMPEMNGTSVLRELRAIRPDVKVVIASGDLVEPWETQVDECNRLAFAHKALGPQELIAQIERLLERKL